MRSDNPYFHECYRIIILLYYRTIIHDTMQWMFDIFLLDVAYILTRSFRLISKLYTALMICYVSGLLLVYITSRYGFSGHVPHAKVIV